MFAISLRALLLLLFIPLGIVFYLIFVFHPARTAHNRRKEELKRIRHEGQTPRRLRRSLKPHNTMGYIKRIAIIVTQKAQENIAWLPCSEMLSDARRGVVERDWRHLNMPPLSQGLIVTEGLQGRSKSVLQRDCLRSPVRLPPAQISSMMTSSAKCRAPFSDRQQTSPYYTKSCFGQNDLPVVTKAREYRRYNRTLSSLVLSDPADVLSRFRLALKTYRGEETPGIIEVSMEELEVSFRGMLDIFNPDGIPLTAQEKAEAVERFNQWALENPPDGLTGGRRGLEEVCTVHFNVFADWLSEELASAFHRNLPERLINHTLRYAPLTKARMSAQSLCSASSSAKMSISGDGFGRSFSRSPSPTPSRSPSPSRSRSPSPTPRSSQPLHRRSPVSPPRPSETAKRTPEKEKYKENRVFPRTASLLISFDDIYTSSPSESPPPTPVVNRKPFLSKN